MGSYTIKPRVCVHMCQHARVNLGNNTHYGAVIKSPISKSGRDTHKHEDEPNRFDFQWCCQPDRAGVGECKCSALEDSVCFELLSVV